MRTQVKHVIRRLVLKHIPLKATVGYTDLWLRAHDDKSHQDFLDYFAVEEVEHMPKETIQSYVYFKHMPKLPLRIVVLEKLTKVLKGK